MRRKINVLQLVEGFSFGGAEKKLLELVKRMNHAKYNFIICSLGLGGRLRQEFEASGIKVYTFTKKAKVDFSLLLRVANLLRREQIDLVQTTLFYADVIGPLACKLAGVPVVFSWETISAPEWLLKRRLFAYKFATRYCTKIISVSEATKRFLVEKRGVSPYRIITIPYGVDLEKFYPQKNSTKREELGLNSRDLIIGVIGRLHKQKGHIYLIHAAKRILEKFPTAKFVFVGDGQLREDLQTKVKSLGLTSSFLFLGFRNDIVELLNIFNIFALPSLYEGLPNVVLEAMACAKPVVATAIDGTPEAVVDGVTGLLVPPRDSEALADAIIDLLENQEKALEMGHKGRQRVETYFALQKQIEKFENLYDHYVERTRSTFL